MKLKARNEIAGGIFRSPLMRTPFLEGSGGTIRPTLKAGVRRLQYTTSRPANQSVQATEWRNHTNLVKRGQSYQIGNVPINLSFKVAIMIHIYNSKKVANSLLCSISKLTNRYDPKNFHWYVNIADTPTAGELKAMVDNALLGKSDYTSVKITPNRGGDIGGLILLSEMVSQSPHQYGYCYFFHSKTNDNWRKALVHPIVNFKLESLSNLHDLGLIGSKQHLHHFVYNPGNHYEFHLKNLSRVTNIPLEIGDFWNFIGGTIFLASIEVINFIGKAKIIYDMLNTGDSIDTNWQYVVGNLLKKNLKGTNNDYQYRHIFKTSLHSDFMIEHTFERFIGLIVNHLKLKVYAA